jgi:tungstate transport system permease protein
VVSILLFRQGPLGELHWIYTVNGMILAQTILSLPIVVSLATAALQTTEPGLLQQARALGAGRGRVASLAVREARIGVLAAIIAALGSSLSEVAAIILVGGNVHNKTETLASAILVEISSGDYSTGIALGILLIGVIAVLTGLLTIAQQREPA